MNSKNEALNYLEEDFVDTIIINYLNITIYS